MKTVNSTPLWVFIKAFVGFITIAGLIVYSQKNDGYNDNPTLSYRERSDYHLCHSG
ncbi:hypothetical protein [Pedobacter kyonggii]|uniref:hypothetical protein n=1 Tax=Pedobacter kyonggii TaxID=1926871 RepID=UPI0013EF3DE0|nr:hypothetical protein [Pedobacter kyonggii]